MKDHQMVGMQWGHSGDTVIACKERMTLEYEKLGISTKTVEEEWKSFEDAFVGIAEDLVDRRSSECNWRKERYGTSGLKFASCGLPMATKYRPGCAIR